VSIKEGEPFSDLRGFPTEDRSKMRPGVTDVKISAVAFENDFLCLAGHTASRDSRGYEIALQDMHPDAVGNIEELDS
jgi:hypothetical protein